MSGYVHWFNTVVERCRLYFLKLLGERYGGVPDEMPPDLLDLHP